MPSLPIPYTRQSIARSGGGGRGGVSRLPSVPDVSSAYSGMGDLSDDMQQTTQALARLAAQEAKARDTARLTAADATFGVELATEYDTILSDQRLDPFDYRQKLMESTQQRIEAVSQDMPSHLQARWKATALKSAEPYIVKIGHEGRKMGVERAIQTFDLRADQLARQIVSESDANQQAILSDQLRDLTSSYVQSGILSQVDAETRLQGMRDKTGQYRWEQFLRLSPDTAVAQLEQGYSPEMGVTPETYSKLLDRSRQVQRERFEWTEAQEAKVYRDTKRQQEAAEAVAMGNIASGRMSRAQLDAMRDRREISPQGYENLTRYAISRSDHARAEARAAESLGLQRAERADRQTEAELSILATTGKLDEKGIIDYAAAKKLRPTAIDGALAKAKSYQQGQQSEYRAVQSQAEQILSKAFTKGPFEVLEPVTAEAYSAALDELTQRSRAFGGKEDPLAVVRDIIPKYQASISQETDVKLEGLRSRLRYPTPDMLEADKASLPPTIYQDQRKVFKEIESLEKRRMTPAEDLGRGKKSESGPGFWERWWGK